MYEQNNELENSDNIITILDENIEDSDELDLVKLVSTNANDANQYLLFLGSDNQYYAKNVSKIEELLVYKDLDIVHNHDKNNYILGTANIRGKMTSIVNFDRWIGNEVLNDEDYELVIIASYGGRRFALVVKEVEYIITIDSHNMSDNSSDNFKSSFISQISVNGVNKLCTIFDSDMLLLDIFDNIEEQSKMDTKSYNSFTKSEKMVLFADDSKYVRKMVEKLFIKLNLNYRLYKDGQELIDDLSNIEIPNIGLVITDIEMPRASGREVIEFIRKNSSYDNINIIVHTNMSNDIMAQEFTKNNVSTTIGKIDMKALGEAIEEYII